MSLPHLKRNAAVADLPDLNDLSNVQFDNSFVRELPGDSSTQNVPRAVRNACYTLVDPTPVRAPRLLAWADPVGEMLGISRPASPVDPVVEVLSGNRVLNGMQPYAARYGGHQFGQWAGQLGDGRAITLGEILCPDGIRRELQLKGSGKTPYSRTADGRAVLRSSVREFLCSEAMHYLGVPTTRALSMVATGDSVVRDMFYDGNPQPETGAIVCRVSPSFVRFGNFEILAAGDESDALKRLADYVIRMHFPELGAPSPATYARWFEEICRRTATLIAEWMRVGFVHGVMNTDNMSILGLTIDYGPYGWLEGYDPQWTPNTTDAHTRRYAYGNQPQIAQWNLARLAEALLPLIPDQAPLEEGLSLYADTFNKAWRSALAHKVGFETLEEPGDDELLADLFALLYEVETDFTLFFRNLAKVSLQDPDQAPLDEAFYSAPPAEHRTALASWLRRYAERSKAAPRDRVERMSRANPKYVFRNYLAVQAIEALERGDASLMERLLQVLERPYDEQPAHHELAARRPEWARDRPGCSALSCSS